MLKPNLESATVTFLNQYNFYLYLNDKCFTTDQRCVYLFILGSMW